MNMQSSAMMTQYNRYVYGPALLQFFTRQVVMQSDWMAGGPVDANGNSGSGKKCFSGFSRKWCSGEGDFLAFTSTTTITTIR
jgi:hypothetical protein